MQKYANVDLIANPALSKFGLIFKFSFVMVIYVSSKLGVNSKF